MGQAVVVAVWGCVGVVGVVLFAGLGLHATVAHRREVRAMGREHR